MSLKFIGGVLLVAGTAIGGGMLGLPIATAAGGIIPSITLLLAAWILMTFTALLTLEANLWFGRDTHFITMVKQTFGVYGEWICWTFYLLFLYSLVAVYIAGGQDLLQHLFSIGGFKAPLWLCAVIFVFVFANIIIHGVKQVEKINTLLMFIKMFALVILMLVIGAHAHFDNFGINNFAKILPATTVAITSFGFSIIIPSLRNYFDDNASKTRLAIIIGSLLPLVCYLIWELVIFGAADNNKLIALQNSANPITGLINIIIKAVNNQNLNLFANVFISVSVLTAFLCVSLGLFDYIKDGLKIYNLSAGKYIIGLCVFTPPLLAVIFYPDSFIKLLSLAGFFCVILQALIPGLIIYKGRYGQGKIGVYEVFGGKISLLLSMLFSILVISIFLIEKL